MPSAFSSLNRTFSSDELRSSQPVDSTQTSQFADSTQEEAWKQTPQPPDQPGADASISQAQQSAQIADPTPQPVATPPQNQQAAPLAPTQQTQEQPQPAPPTDPAAPSDQAPPVTAAQPQANYPDESQLPNYKPLPEEVLLEWQAPSRPFKQHSKQYYSTILIISILVSIILFFANQLVFVAVIAALVFLSYVLMTTPPNTIKHQLTTYGMRVEDNLYYWEELGRFWFTKKYGTDLLHIEVARFPNRLTLLLGDIPKDDMQAILSEILLNEQPPPTFYEKAAAWLQEKLPLEIDQ